MEKWGMFARQHSTLLLQIDTTNALESYYRSIKRRCYLTDGFVATLKELHKIFQGKISMHAKISNQLFTKRLAECEEYPRLAEFAHPFQVLIAREIREGEHLVSEDVDPILESDQLHPRCSCLFFRKYFLPCRHMFQLDQLIEDGWLNDAIWDTFAGHFAECCFEVFYKHERVNVPAATEPSKGQQARMVFYSQVEGITDIFWRIQESGDVHKEQRLQKVIESCRLQCNQLLLEQK
jgi:hypothetical protein